MRSIVIVIVSLTIAVNAASVSKPFMENWRTFKMQHGKTYEDENEEEYRMQVYKNNSRQIDEHNKRFAAGEVSFKLGMNEFGDLHFHEFKRSMLMNSVTINELNESTNKFCQLQSPYDSSTTTSDSWNWVEKGAVTPVRDQGPCGSCWAFSAVGALEGHHFIKSGKLVNLSEQNLMDCSAEYGNSGCKGAGGWPEAALLYVIDNGGIDTRESYPYVGRSEVCRYNSSNSGVSITGCRKLPPDDEEQLKIAVEKEGPVSVGMTAATYSFQFYKSGIYFTDQCDHLKLDHAVLIVGYGTENGQDYWLVKNSWNTVWGEGGYFRIVRNAGSHCGIASISVFPVTNKH